MWTFCINKVIRGRKRGKDVVFFVIIFLQLFACGFQYVQQANDLERKYFYYRAINLINEKYKKKELQNKENLKKWFAFDLQNIGSNYYNDFKSKDNERLFYDSCCKILYSNCKSDNAVVY